MKRRKAKPRRGKNQNKTVEIHDTDKGKETRGNEVKTNPNARVGRKKESEKQFWKVDFFLSTRQAEKEFHFGLCVLIVGHCQVRGLSVRNNVQTGKGIGRNKETEVEIKHFSPQWNW